MVRIVFLHPGAVYVRQNTYILCLASSQWSDGETPLFLGFFNVGEHSGQHYALYKGYTHFLWHYVADKIMNEPQSGTITFGLKTRYFLLNIVS